LALFGKIVRRLTKHLQDIQRLSLGQDIPLQQPAVSTLIKGANAESGFKATEQTIEEDLADSHGTEDVVSTRENLLEGVDLAE
jgi:N-acetyltransferase 10